MKRSFSVVLRSFLARSLSVRHLRVAELLLDEERRRKSLIGYQGMRLKLSSCLPSWLTCSRFPSPENQYFIWTSWEKQRASSTVISTGPCLCNKPRCLSNRETTELIESGVVRCVR